MEKVFQIKQHHIASALQNNLSDAPIWFEEVIHSKLEKHCGFG